MRSRFLKVSCLITPWQITSNAYNHHSPVHSSRSRPLTDHWKLSNSLKSETQACGFWSLTSRCRKTMTSVFSSVKTLTGQGGTSKIRPLCYPNFNNWTVIGSNNSVDSVKNPYNLHSQEWKIFLRRVWSWLRMNAGGVPNTCKSNGDFSNGILVANGWVTRWWPAPKRGITDRKVC